MPLPFNHIRDFYLLRAHEARLAFYSLERQGARGASLELQRKINEARLDFERFIDIWFDYATQSGKVSWTD